MNTPVTASLPPPNGPRRTSAMAITSLVAGILGWTLLPFIGSVVAIITGHMARSEIKRSNGQVEGDGIAIGGLILGYLVVGMAVLSIIAIVLLLGGLAGFFALFGNGSW